MSVLDKFLDAIRLNDDFDDDDEFFDDDELEALEDEKPKHRFFKKLEDDLDNEEDEEETYVKPAKKIHTADLKQPSASAAKTAKQQPKTVPSSSKITPMRNRKPGTGNNMEVCVIKPSSMEDTRDIADTLIDRCTVVLNLEGIDVDVAQRIIDFSSGACYSIGGSLQLYFYFDTCQCGDFWRFSGNFEWSLRCSLGKD